MRISSIGGTSLVLMSRLANFPYTFSEWKHGRFDATQTRIPRRKSWNCIAIQIRYHQSGHRIEWLKRCKNMKTGLHQRMATYVRNVESKKKKKGMRAANVIATFIKSTAIKYNTWFFQFLLNNPGEKRRFAIHQALQSVRDIPFDSAPYCFHSHSFFHNYHKNPCDPSFYVFFKRWVTYCLPRNVPLRKRRSQRKTRAREKPAGYEINEINSKMFATSIFLLYSCYTIVFHSIVYYSFI